ncbi:hypothetical protein HD597_000833 [Nonomuraea thailandensis]|uniref:Uncharacterized protein n=1 Tax=Nonomuraea thailandensis TaxID=1188745 RepID=A0A9X2JYH2_9ACTN|nr:hypothetical protein [Nonomuraea thailandensis]
MFTTLTATQAAAGAQTVSIPYCPSGYLCPLTASGSPWTVLVEEGDRWSFPSGLEVVGVSNQTQLNYCVGASLLSYRLAPGREVSHSHTAPSVGPSGFCVS